MNRIIPDCVKSKAKGEKVKIRNLTATRPWQHVIEILNGYLRLAKKLSKDKKLNGQSFNFGPKNSEIVPVSRILKVLNLIGLDLNGKKLVILLKMKPDC